MSEVRFLFTLANVHWGPVAEITTAVATLGLVGVAFVQLRRFNRQVRADGHGSWAAGSWKLSMETLGNAQID